MRVQRVRVQNIHWYAHYHFDYTTLLLYRISKIQVKQIKNVW